MPLGVWRSRKRPRRWIRLEVLNAFFPAHQFVFSCSTDEASLGNKKYVFFPSLVDRRALDWGRRHVQLPEAGFFSVSGVHDGLSLVNVRSFADGFHERFRDLAAVITLQSV